MEYSGNLDLEEGEIPDDVIGATGDHLYIPQHSLASLWNSGRGWGLKSEGGDVFFVVVVIYMFSDWDDRIFNS